MLAYGNKKYRFYNPVLQNNGHIDALKKSLTGIADVPFFSVIVFGRKCTLKNVSHIPENTFIVYPNGVKSIIEYIVANNQPANYSDKWGVVNTLRNAVANGDNRHIVQRHIQDVRKYSLY